MFGSARHSSTTRAARVLPALSVLLVSLLLVGTSAAQSTDPLAEARALEAEIVRAFGEGDPQRAAELAARQLDLRESASDGPDLGVAASLSYLALAHRNLDEFAAAQLHARRALAITIEVRGERALDTATALNNLAGILRERGDAVAAERALQSALSIRTESLSPDHPALAQTYNNLASLRLQQGDPASAQELYAEALRIVIAVQGAAHDNALKARQNLARALVGRGDVEAARAELEIVESALRRADPVVASRLADVVAQRAAIEFGEGRLDAAESAYREAIALRRSVTGDVQLEVVAAQIALARIRARQGATEDARELHEHAVRDAQRAVGEEHPLTLEARCAAADLALSRGEHADAIAWLEPATAPYVQTRRRAAEGLRSATARVESPFARLAIAHARNGQPELAWEAAEHGRGQLLDTALHREDHAPGQVLPELLAALDARTAAVGWVEIGLPNGSSARAAWVVRRGAPVRWIDLASGHLAALALLDTVNQPPDLFEPTDPKTLEALGRRAFDEEFAAIVPHLEGVERVVLVPDGVLLGLPLAVLIDDEGLHLDERFTLELTPSLRTWLDAGRAQPRPARQRSVLALGDPPFRPEHVEPAGTPRSAPRRGTADLAKLPRLTGTRDEAVAARSHFARGELLLGIDASEARLREFARHDRLRDFDVLHLATHALVDVERPGLSLLALSQLDLPPASRSLTREGPLEDGALTVDEILAEWQLDADLVTLSACNTGLGRVTAGEGLLGFAQAFLMVGARSLVLSSWEVDDVATALLMERFYATLESDPGRVRPAVALRDAQRWLRALTDERGDRPYAHPYYWAAFVAVSVR